MYIDDKPNGEEGFTLIELMVVILIIGILIAIALPTFLGARTRAQDRAAQTNLRSGLAAALTYFAESGNFDGYNAGCTSAVNSCTEAEAAEPSLAWRGGALGEAPGQGEIKIQIAAGTGLLLGTRSGSGTYFCVLQLPNSPATDRGTGSVFTAVDETTECNNGWNSL